jgi:hypothetical protein
MLLIPYPKLQTIGIIGKILNIIVSFLSERKQFVKFDKMKSELFDVTSGVIQGLF